LIIPACFPVIVLAHVASYAFRSRPGFMRLVKDRVLHAWRGMQGDARQRIAEIERKQKSIREKRDRLDQAFLLERLFRTRKKNWWTRRVPVRTKSCSG